MSSAIRGTAGLLRVAVEPEAKGNFVAANDIVTVSKYSVYGH